MPRNNNTNSLLRCAAAQRQPLPAVGHSHHARAAVEEMGEDAARPAEQEMPLSDPPPLPSRSARLGSCLTEHEAERALKALRTLGISIVTHSDSTDSSMSADFSMVIVSSSDLESAKRRRTKFLHGLRYLVNGAVGEEGTGASRVSRLSSGCSSSGDGGRNGIARDVDADHISRTAPASGQGKRRDAQEEQHLTRAKRRKVPSAAGGGGRKRGSKATWDGEDLSETGRTLEQESTGHAYSHTFSKQDEGSVIEIDCEDDGFIPVLLLKQQRGEVFRVRFLSDNNEMTVDLSEVRFRLISTQAAQQHDQGVMEPAADQVAANAKYECGCGACLRVVGLDVVEACAAGEFSLAYLSMPCSSPAHAPAGACTCVSKMETEEKEPEVAWCEWVGGVSGVVCSVVLTATLKNVEVNCYYLLHEARNDRRKKKEVQDLVFLALAMGATVSLSPPPLLRETQGEGSNGATQGLASSPKISHAVGMGCGHAECKAKDELMRIVMIGDTKSEMVGELLYSIARSHAVEAKEERFRKGENRGNYKGRNTHEEINGTNTETCTHGFRDHIDSGDGYVYPDAGKEGETSGRGRRQMQVVRTEWLWSCWKDGYMHDPWLHRPQMLAGLMLCSSGQGPERKMQLRCAAISMGAGWSDELDKIKSSMLIVDCQYHVLSQQGAAPASGEVCGGRCANCNTSKAVYARRHGIPLLSEQWLWDSIRAGVALDLYLERYALEPVYSQGVSLHIEERIKERQAEKMGAASASSGATESPMKTGATVKRGTALKGSSPPKGSVRANLCLSLVEREMEMEMERARRRDTAMADAAISAERLASVAVSSVQKDPRTCMDAEAFSGAEKQCVALETSCIGTRITTVAESERLAASPAPTLSPLALSSRAVTASSDAATVVLDSSETDGASGDDGNGSNMDEQSQRTAESVADLEGQTGTDKNVGVVFDKIRKPKCSALKGSRQRALRLATQRSRVSAMPTSNLPSSTAAQAPADASAVEREAAMEVALVGSHKSVWWGQIMEMSSCGAQVCVALLDQDDNDEAGEMGGHGMAQAGEVVKAGQGRKRQRVEGEESKSRLISRTILLSGTGVEDEGDREREKRHWERFALRRGVGGGQGLRLASAVQAALQLQMKDSDRDRDRDIESVESETHARSTDGSSQGTDAMPSDKSNTNDVSGPREYQEDGTDDVHGHGRQASQYQDDSSAGKTASSSITEIMHRQAQDETDSPCKVGAPLEATDAGNVTALDVSSPRAFVAAERCLLVTPDTTSKDPREHEIPALQHASISRRMTIPPFPLDVVCTPPRAAGGSETRRQTSKDCNDANDDAQQTAPTAQA